MLHRHEQLPRFYNGILTDHVRAGLRRLDHAVIYVMIAASLRACAPFALNAFPQFSGRLLFSKVNR